MSRRINTGTLDSSLSVDALRLGRKKGAGGDDYLGRLAGYIPAEVVGLYVATSGMVPLKAPNTPNYTALWVIFTVTFAFVPLYFLFATTRGKKKPLWPQVVLATLAYPVWVFAIGGPFTYFHWYQGWIASVTLAFVTVAMGFYKPAAGS
jgi:hypothetical protein